MTYSDENLPQNGLLHVRRSDHQFDLMVRFRMFKRQSFVDQNLLSRFQHPSHGVAPAAQTPTGTHSEGQDPAAAFDADSKPHVEKNLTNGN